MSSQHTELCNEVDESLGDILDGLAASRLMDHIAECDVCRDKRYEAERAVEVVEAAGLDFRVGDDFAERMIAAVEAARPTGPTGAIMTPLIRQSGEVSKLTSAGVDAPTSQPLSASNPAESGPVISGARAIDGTAPTMLAPSSLEERLASSGRGPEGDATIAAIDVNRTTIDAMPPVDVDAAPLTGPNKTIVLTPVSRREGDVSDAKRAPVVEAITGKSDTSKSDPGVTSASGDDVDVVRPRRAGPTIEAAPIDLRAANDASTSTSSGPVATTKSKTAAAVATNVKPSGRVLSLFRKPAFLGALGTGMAAAAVAGFFLLGKNDKVNPPPPVATFVDGAWTGTVESVARASADGQSGVQVCSGEKRDKCDALSKGGKIEAGSVVRTDARTRARLALVDGTVLSLDRNSEVTFANTSTREASVRGLVIADVAKADKAVPAKFTVPQGQVEIVDPKIDAKLAITTTDQRASIEVARSSVKITNDGGSSWAKVRSGEEASLGTQGAPTIGTRHTMSDMLEWSDQSPEQVDGALKGVGELRAKKPGETTEKDHAVRLSKHNVKVRVVDVVARTEVDETFTNDSDDVLEGIYRFPLPPDAQIEKLALEVDGKLVEGAFVDRDKGAAIWRGAIHNAAPQQPKPREEIVWVPGPWHDPALLEWQRGGRFELHIFPIPKHGSRRVVITYTQTVQQSGGVRKFSYPLGLDASATNKIDEFGIDLQVLGLDKGFGLSTRGYQLSAAPAPNGGQRLVLDEKNFIPAGDLNVEYALPDRDHDLTTWAYQMPGVVPATSPPVPPVASTGNAKLDRERIAKANAQAIADDASPYVAISVRPKLPRWGEGHERVHVIVVDSSRSMVGERFSRATRLASSLVREMDRRDQFMVMACDTTCQVMGASATNSLGQVLEPSPESASEVERFLGGIEPDGGSDLFVAVQAARSAIGSTKGKELRILYLGDGTPTVGPTRPATIEAAVKQALPAGDGALVAVALGNDADTTTLSAMARGGGGVMMPYVPGQRVSAAALDVLSAAYGSMLSDVQVELPSGLVQVTPTQLDSIPAGGEGFVYARMTQPNVKGTIKLRGRVNGDAFEQSYPADITATSDGGNAFVPRLFAASKIDDLEREGRAEDKESVVALSQKFAVASRFTSLLVLESEAMFKAFGLERGSLNSGFSGEVGAHSESSSTTTKDSAAAEEQAEPDADDVGAASGKAKKAERAADMMGGADFESPTPTTPSPPPMAGNGGFAQPAPTTAPAAKPVPQADKSRGPSNDPFSPDWSKSPPKQQPVVATPPPMRMVAMRRVWDRHANFVTTNVTPPTLATALADAQAASTAAPNSRDKTVSLFKLLVASSQVSDATELASKWAQRDALDPDALVARADLAAMNGDRQKALRILSGLADVRPGDKAIQEKLVNTFASLSPDLACQFRVSLADLDPSNVNNVAAAAVCSQNLGFLNLSNAIVAGVDSTLHDRVTTAMKTVKLDPKAAFGDVRAEATWTGRADLDVAVIDAKGNRISSLGSPLKFVSASCTDARATDRESCAFSGLTSGNYALEITRTTPSTEPISGTLKLTSPEGQVRSVPFTLTGTRVVVGAVQVSFTERLVPVNDPGGGWR